MPGPILFHIVIFSVLKLGFFYLLNRMVLLVTVSVHLYLTMSRQEDLESPYALCKVFGLTFIPLLFICNLMAFIGLFKGDIDTFYPIVRLLSQIMRLLVAVGIIVTTDDLRSYSAENFYSIFKCLKNLVNAIFCCQWPHNEIHPIIE